MILYLDTSALVKLYVAEPGSQLVRGWTAPIPLVAVSRIAYPEARAAFGRRQREGGLGELDLRRVVARLEEDMGRLLVVELTQIVAAAAGTLAERRALRGLDAIQLASATELAARAGDAVAFGCFDERLSTAAAAEGLRLPATP